MLGFGSVLLLSACSNKMSDLPYGPPDARIVWYQKYSADLLNQSLEAGKHVVLSVGANRSPLCRALHKDLMKEAVWLPDDIVILTIDFDRDQDLVAQYEVKHEHTLLFLDTKWNVVKKTENKYSSHVGIVAVVRELFESDEEIDETNGPDILINEALDDDVVPLEEIDWLSDPLEEIVGTEQTWILIVE